MTRRNPQLCLDAGLNSAPCRSWTFVNLPDGGAEGLRSDDVLLCAGCRYWTLLG
jgi:hypothetical protein